MLFNSLFSPTVTPQVREINDCPHVGWSGGCDDCVLELEPMTCQEEKNSMEEL